MITEKDIVTFKKAIKDFIEKSEKERYEKISSQLNMLTQGQRELSKFVPDIKRLKEKVAELETTIVKPEDISERESAIKAEIDETKKLISVNSKEIARLSEVISTMSSTLAEIQDWIKKSRLTTDIEALKAREAMIEAKLRKMDPALIVQRLDNIESELKKIRTAEPFIIE